MPISQPYDPYAATPYTAPELPQPTPAMPSPLPQGPPQANGAVKSSGAIATMADSILRGFMQGRAMHQASQVMKLKKQSDDLLASYNVASQQLVQMHQAGVDPNSDDYKRAKSAVDGSWGAIMNFYGQHIEQPKAAKKGSKVQQAGQSLVEMLHSKDPMQVSQAWYQIAQKAGPPVYSHIAAQNAQGGDPVKSALREYDQLSLAQNRTKEQDARFTQLQGFLESRGALKAKAAAAGRWVQGKQVLASELPQGAAEAREDESGNLVEGAEIDKREVDPSTVFYPMFQGNRVVYMRTNPNLTTTKLAEPGSGREGVYNRNPVSGQVQGAPIGETAAKNQYHSVTTADENGNPQTQFVPIAPSFRAPTTHPGAGAPAAPAPSQEVAPGLHARPESGVTALPATDPASSTPSTPTSAEATPSSSRRRERAGAQTAPSKTPQQQKALDQHVTRITKQAGVPSGGYTFEKFSKDNQQKFNAIRSQELTINGKAGSDTDIGLRRATENVFKSKDPELPRKIAVVMDALDKHSKQSLSSTADGDYSFVTYLHDAYMTIPTIQHAMNQLGNSPEGKVYLDNFFRAWTNAATIRSLQGTSGKPSQSMYAMLVNELPMIGVNVNTQADAMRKVDLLQDDVDTAAETLPGKAKNSLAAMKNKSRGEGTPAHQAAQHKGLDDEIMGALK